MLEPSQIKELRALVSLLDEPDEDNYKIIWDKIYSYGIDAIPNLQIAWENSLDPIIQKKIEDLTHKIQFDNLCYELMQWSRLGNTNLLLGVYLITKYQYPELKQNDLKTQIEDIKKDIWLELNEHLTSLEKIKVFNHIFYDIYGFRGNDKSFHAPQNSYLNLVLESKKGNPLSLGIIYLVVAQMLELPIYGVNLPEHFILAFTNEKGDNNLSFLYENDVLFYLNPFNKGAVFTKKEIDLFIKQLKLEPDPAYYIPCSNLIIVQRIINNLIYAYEKMGYTEKINELKILANCIKIE